VDDAGYPGSKKIPAAQALLSLPTLKLLDKERRSHINDFNFDEALGLFAGLNILPKKSFATDYSYRTQRTHQEKLLTTWIGKLATLLFPQPTPPAWTTTTCRCVARPVPACSPSSPKSKKAVFYATPTPT
jgi:hypothetical protein